MRACVRACVRVCVCVCVCLCSPGSVRRANDGRSWSHLNVRAHTCLSAQEGATNALQRPRRHRRGRGQCSVSCLSLVTVSSACFCFVAVMTSFRFLDVFMLALFLFPHLPLVAQEKCRDINDAYTDYIGPKLSQAKEVRSFLCSSLVANISPTNTRTQVVYFLELQAYGERLERPGILHVRVLFVVLRVWFIFASVHNPCRCEWMGLKMAVVFFVVFNSQNFSPYVEICRSRKVRLCLPLHLTTHTPHTHTQCNHCAQPVWEKMGVSSHGTPGQTPFRTYFKTFLVSVQRMCANG